MGLISREEGPTLDLRPALEYGTPNTVQAHDWVWGRSLWECSDCGKQIVKGFLVIDKESNIP